MWRYLTGAAAMFVLMAAGYFLSRQMAANAVGLPPPLSDVPRATVDGRMFVAPVADERTREARRFARYDKNKDGMVGSDEYLATRQKAFARLDANHDGVLSFAEYATKTTEKFRKADIDHSGSLNAKEFATTKPVRKARPIANCPPVPQPSKASDGESDAEG